MDIKNFSKDYILKKIVKEDFFKVYTFYRNNTLYYETIFEIPTLETVKQDILACPKGKSIKDKFYLGIFRNKDFIGVLDFVVDYPKEKNLFIGLFMIDIKLQNKGFGSKVIQEFFKMAKANGFSCINLAYIKNYEKSEKFWVKNGFQKINKEIEKEKYTLVLMEKNYEK